MKISIYVRVEKSEQRAELRMFCAYAKILFVDYVGACWRNDEAKLERFTKHIVPYWLHCENSQLSFMLNQQHYVQSQWIRILSIWKDISARWKAQPPNVLSHIKPKKGELIWNISLRHVSYILLKCALFDNSQCWRIFLAER